MASDASASWRAHTWVPATAAAAAAFVVALRRKCLTRACVSTSGRYAHASPPSQIPLAKHTASARDACVYVGCALRHGARRRE